jgi:hypothetical protein
VLSLKSTRVLALKGTRGRRPNKIKNLKKRQRPGDMYFMDGWRIRHRVESYMKGCMSVCFRILEDKNSNVKATRGFPEKIEMPTMTMFEEKLAEETQRKQLPPVQLAAKARCLAIELYSTCNHEMETKENQKAIVAVIMVSRDEEIFDQLEEQKHTTDVTDSISGKVKMVAGHRLLAFYQTLALDQHKFLMRRTLAVLRRHDFVCKNVSEARKLMVVLITTTQDYVMANRHKHLQDQLGGVYLGGIQMKTEWWMLLQQHGGVCQFIHMDSMKHEVAMNTAIIIDQTGDNGKGTLSVKDTRATFINDNQTDPEGDRSLPREMPVLNPLGDDKGPIRLSCGHSIVMPANQWHFGPAPEASQFEGKVTQLRTMMFSMAAASVFIEEHQAIAGGEQVFEWTNLTFEHHCESRCQGPEVCQGARNLLDCLLRDENIGWWEHYSDWDTFETLQRLLLRNITERQHGKQK